MTDYERYDPSAWAIRLAASFLDMDLDHSCDECRHACIRRGRGGSLLSFGLGYGKCDGQLLSIVESYDERSHAW